MWESARVFGVKSEMLLRELECCSTCALLCSMSLCGRVLEYLGIRVNCCQVNSSTGAFMRDESAIH